ncbi:MAG TPA: 4-hydroxyphenylpyruvate dioxygenase [Vicinamibacterales bacterium]|nr:4-hydroxyphenylpyruvate dioxygenase [Vicinamibacterales bacterium]
MPQIQNPFGVYGVDYVEIYVSNCRQAAYYYRTALGFTMIGQVAQDDAGGRRSIALQQGDIRLILTSPITPSSEVAEHIYRHGEGIKDVALAVTDAERVFDHAVAAGASPLAFPTTRQLPRATIRTAKIGTCGNLVHTLVERPAGSIYEWPGVVTGRPRGTPNTGLVDIDHLALAVGAGELEPHVDFYISALGFEETHQENVTTEYSAMRSKVVQSPNGRVRFPIMEPAPGRRRSQIDSYVNAHQGPGVQHLALRSNDIVSSVAMLADVIDFLPTPDAYFDSLPARVGDLAGELKALRHYGILADRDATGLLLQVFTKPIGARPTLFLEVIERRGAEGFGGGNIKALFEAVERAEETAAVPS